MHFFASWFRYKTFTTGIVVIAFTKYVCLSTSTAFHIMRKCSPRLDFVGLVLLRFQECNHHKKHCPWCCWRFFGLVCHSMEVHFVLNSSGSYENSPIQRGPTSVPYAADRTVFHVVALLAMRLFNSLFFFGFSRQTKI